MGDDLPEGFINRSRRARAVVVPMVSPERENDKEIDRTREREAGSCNESEIYTATKKLIKFSSWCLIEYKTHIHIEGGDL